ncbi:MAG: DUF721 domain-containing protein [Nannocystaceae bacterium]|nr:DUF721 domain-containing protein [bacterium]
MPRRTNHGQRRAAGEFAQHAVQTIVPTERLRLTRLQIAWPAMVGERIRAVAWPGALRGTKLVLHVRDTQWQHELSYMVEQLRDRIAQRCPECPVSSIRMRVGEVPERPPPPPPEPKPDIVDLPSEPPSDTVDALSGVTDPSLRKMMANARMALSGRLRK